jgi:tetratricopeptide (TPR) repeat protein
MSYEKLAETFLNQADELIDTQYEDPDKFLEALEQAEKAALDNLLVLCHSARALFRYGLLHSAGQFFFLALDKLMLVEEKSSSFLTTDPIWWQLWGNILVELGKLIDDAIFFEMAIEKYRCAEVVTRTLGCQNDATLYWDWGNAWALLGQTSGEPIDFQQAISKFAQGINPNNQSKNGCRSYFLGHSIASPFFLLDYGRVFLDYGQLVGNPYFVEEAIALFRHVIASSDYPRQLPSAAYIAAWKQLALSLKIRFFLTHKLEHLEEANSSFREAILIHAKNGSLWLDWGELYLHGGWLRKDLKLIQIGLEKLTASKIKECDPFRVAALLGTGLMLTGLFLEHLKLIKEGKERVFKALEIDPGNTHLKFAWTFALLAPALYFANKECYAQAVSYLQQEITNQPQVVENWHALFQIDMAWGSQVGDIECIKKAIASIAHVCLLRPYSVIYWNEWGVALLRLKEMDNEHDKQIVYLEEAIDKFFKAAELGEDEETLYNWGCALDLLGDISGDEEDYEKAIALLSEALRKNHGHPHVRYHLAMAYSHLGELTADQEYLKEAIVLLELLLRIDPDDENVWSNLGYAQLNLAELPLDARDPQERIKYQREAEKSLIRAAQLGNEGVYYYLACLYSLTGLHALSMKYLIRAEIADCLPYKTDLEQDDWLDGIRHTAVFQDFLMSLGEDG